MDITIDLAFFSNALNSALLCVSKDDTRPHLKAIYVVSRFDGDTSEVSIYSTDGHRAFRARERVPRSDSPYEGRIAIPEASARTVSQSVAIALKKASAEEKVRISNENQDHASVTFGAFATTITLRGSDEMPPFDTVLIPSSVSQYADKVPAFGVNADYLSDACTIAKLFRGTVTETLRMKGRLKTVTRKAKTSNFTIQTSGELDPIRCTFQDPRALYVVMPVRI